MKVLNTKNKNFKKNFELILNSKRNQSGDNTTIVKKILKDINRDGDKSLLKYTKK